MKTPDSTEREAEEEILYITHIWEEARWSGFDWHLKCIGNRFRNSLICHGLCRLHRNLPKKSESPRRLEARIGAWRSMYRTIIVECQTNAAVTNCEDCFARRACIRYKKGLFVHFQEDYLESSKIGPSGPTKKSRTRSLDPRFRRILLTRWGPL